MNDEVLLDSRQLDQWLTDGGTVFPKDSEDEDAEEDERLARKALANWLRRLVGNDLELALKLASKEISYAQFARELDDLNRSTGKRRFEKFCAILCERVYSNPDLFSTLPSPWRECLAG